MLIAKDYITEFRRFISSQYLYTGIRVTSCVIVPAWILYQAGLISTMIGIPLGALFVGLADNPGPVHHRRNGMLVSIFLNVIVVLIAGLGRSVEVLIIAEIVLFGIVFSMIAVFGTRASSIGLTALIIFILGTNEQFAHQNIWQNALFYLIGGALYMLVSLSLDTLRPFRPAQQLLGECLMKTASYLQTRGMFYAKNPGADAIISRLIEQQVRIHNYQEQLREMLFSTRQFISESTSKGRILTMMYRDSVDLFERTVTTHQDYDLLHKEFDDTGIMDIIHSSINTMASVLFDIGISVQEGTAYRDDKRIDDALAESTHAFRELRKRRLQARNIEHFIKLRQIIYILSDLADRIKRLQYYTSFDKSIASQYKGEVDLSKFISHRDINLNLFVSNISLKSAAFRHALRLTLGLLVGYIVSMFFSVGHGYWILLTVATIIKPAYGLTRQRNFQRLGGTFAGIATGFLVLYLAHNDTFIFVIMIVMMITAYSLLRINYAVSIGALTVYLLLSFHFLYPQGLNSLLIDRILDTVIGSVIAYFISYFVFPVWEHQQIDRLMSLSIQSAQNYFLTVSGAFVGKNAGANYKVARKEAFVALANLSDSFQRMSSDPKTRQLNLPLYHQFASGVHLLISHIAALSDYAQKYSSAYQHADFQPLINMIDKKFTDMGSDKHQMDQTTDLQAIPLLKRVSKLLEQRRKEIEQSGPGSEPTDSSMMMGEMVRITDQFKVIYSTANELQKIISELNQGRITGLQTRKAV